MITFQDKVTEKALLPSLEMWRTPTFRDINDFRDNFEGRISKWSFLRLRQQFREDASARKLLTFGATVRELLGENYQLIAHGNVGRSDLRQPLQLAYDVATANHLAVSSKKAHFQLHFQNLILELYAEQYADARSAWLTSRDIRSNEEWDQRLARACRHPQWVTRKNGKSCCLVCRTLRDDEAQKREHMLEARIADALVETSYRDLMRDSYRRGMTRHQYGI